jgi:bromodomain-containing protein 7/9
MFLISLECSFIGNLLTLLYLQSDLKLVTTNAKLFNPPGSIYYTEADRLETWALDHISKASATVIQYETDWNIEIEKDDEGPPVNVDDDEDYAMGTPMEVDATSLRERSVSILSQPQPGPSRRGPRGPYKKQAPSTALSETLEPDGGLPGSKDGLGSFPPGSDWAKTMVALKLKGASLFFSFLNPFLKCLKASDIRQKRSVCESSAKVRRCCQMEV